jgi:hypothetical protein
MSSRVMRVRMVSFTCQCASVYVHYHYYVNCLLLLLLLLLLLVLVLLTQPYLYHCLYAIIMFTQLLHPQLLLLLTVL